VTRAVILGGVRTPFAKAGGALADASVTDLGRIVMAEALARTGIAPVALDHVVFGCAGMPSDSANPARVAALRAGLPEHVPALTVQRNCASGMEAIVQAAQLVESRRADVVLCGGMESMSNYAAEFPASYRRKMGSLARAKALGPRLAALMRFRPRDFVAEWGLVKGLQDPACGLNMGQTAEVLARELGFSRAEQDAFALLSHRRAVAARARLQEEIVPVPIPGKPKALPADDGVREDQSLEKLAKLRPAFSRSHGTVTPGNACGITDGACAVIVASEEWASATGHEPLARIVSWAVAGVAPERMGLGPCAALPRAL
jgi:acetyl-CoA acetyltransferase family protein